MENLRASFRLLCFSLIASLTVLFTLAAKPLPLSIYLKWKNACTFAFAHFTMAIIGMDLKIKGTPPETPFFMVSNHLSYIDILPLWACCKGTFIAKSEIKGWPFFGFATRSMGVLFINRNENKDIKRVNALITEHLSQEQGIILFPEGTSTNGKKVLPFKSSLLHYPAKEEVPVSYATISYDTLDETKPASRYVCWWGKMTFFSHFFEMLKLKSFSAEIRFGDRKIAKNNRKELALMLHQEVSRAFNTVNNEN